MEHNEYPGAIGALAEGIGGDVCRELSLAPGGDPERHPTIDNVNALLAECCRLPSTIVDE